MRRLLAVLGLTATLLTVAAVLSHAPAAHAQSPGTFSQLFVVDVSDNTAPLDVQINVVGFVSLRTHPAGQCTTPPVGGSGLVHCVWPAGVAPAPVAGIYLVTSTANPLFLTATHHATTPQTIQIGFSPDPAERALTWTPSTGGQCSGSATNIVCVWSGVPAGHSVSLGLDLIAGSGGAPQALPSSPLPSRSSISSQTRAQICASFVAVQPAFVRARLLAQAACPPPPACVTDNSCAALPPA